MSKSSQNNERIGQRLSAVFHEICRSRCITKFALQTNAEYVRDGEIEYPYEDITAAGDQNKARGNWYEFEEKMIDFRSNQFDFIVSCCALAVGFANVFRLPFLVYSHGTGTN